MTRSAGDAVIPHSLPGRWRSACSSVQTRVHTSRPVRTACTGCAEVSAASGGPQGAEIRLDPLLFQGRFVTRMLVFARNNINDRDIDSQQSRNGDAENSKSGGITVVCLVSLQHYNTKTMPKLKCNVDF